MPCRRARCRAGVMLTQLGFFLLVLLGFAAIAVDLSSFYSQQAELQVAATSAAAGAALELPDGSVAAAVQLAEANLPSSVHGAVILSSDVQLGRWDASARAFTPNAAPLNAVRVTARKSGARGNAPRWLLASVFGLAPPELAATATASLLPELPGAIGATGSIDIGGNAYIDSYDASQGPYGSQNPGDNGDVVTNGPVSVSGSAVVNGDVRGSPVSISGSATATGSASAQRRPLEFPLVDTTSIAVDNDNGTLPLYQKGNTQVSPLDANRNFELTGGVDYEIPSGNYYFNDLRIAGQSTLTVSGPTVIYLTGDLDTSGGDVINSSENPTYLQIYMTGGSATLTASVDWYGLLYAPNTSVTVNGGGDIYGAIIGQDVDVGGTGDIHFDASLTVSDQILGLAKRSAIVD